MKTPCDPYVICWVHKPPSSYRSYYSCVPSSGTSYCKSKLQRIEKIVIPTTVLLLQNAKAVFEHNKARTKSQLRCIHDTDTLIATNCSGLSLRLNLVSRVKTKPNIKSTSRNTEPQVFAWDPKAVGWRHGRAWGSITTLGPHARIFSIFGIWTL